jgi:hypothetical protein
VPRSARTIDPERAVAPGGGVAAGGVALRGVAAGGVNLGGVARSVGAAVVDGRDESRIRAAASRKPHPPYKAAKAQPRA